MQFHGFSKEGSKFLKDLSNNNSKEWFERNRHIWQKTIQEPNISFIEDMGETLQILVPNIKFNPKVSASLFKIYRDVRFSKDKTPMKSKIGLLFWQGSGHRMQSSSFYMHYTADDYFIASGIRNFKAPMLKTYREYLLNEKNRDKLHQILEELKSKGYLIADAKFKRVPKIFTGDESHIYLTLFNSMFSYIEFKINEEFYKEEFINKAFKIYDDMKDIQEWVYEMTLTSKEH